MPDTPGWHTPHDARDIGVMNDAHRRALCAGASLESGDIWIACKGHASGALMLALASCCTFDDGHNLDHAAGHLVVEDQTWGWHFEYFETETLSAPADPANQQVFRLLVCSRRGA